MNAAWDKLLKESAKTNKLRHQAWECIEKKDFDGFCESLKKYLKKGWPDDDSYVKGIVHTMNDWRINDNKYQDQAIDYILKGEFASEALILMAYWTHPQNERFSRRMGKKPHEKYKDLLHKGFSVTDKQYKAYCSVFNIEQNFLDAKNKFLQEQKEIQSFLLSQKLDNELNNDDKPVIRKKI